MDRHKAHLLLRGAAGVIDSEWAAFRLFLGLSGVVSQAATGEGVERGVEREGEGGGRRRGKGS